MSNRRPQNNGRRMDSRNDQRNKNFGRVGVSPWQGGGPGLPNLLPLAGGSTEATLALASNIINLLQPRQNPVPSLLDMPIRRDFGPNMGRFDRPYGPNRMGNQVNFRRTGNYNHAGERINTKRRPFRPNDGQRQQNKSSPKKEADSKAKPVKESEQEEKNGEQQTSEPKEVKEEDKEKKDVPKTRYDDINPQFLSCHICNKNMWDGRSFENHLSGRAHAIMMRKTAESYALTADTMRQEFKIREMKRTRKIGQQPARDFYCAMCDMYAADGAVHRTNVGHRKLKKFLHPTCTSCHMEMPNRIELDEHRLSPEHLRTLQEKQGTVSKPKPEVMVISTISMEQSYLREDRHRWRHGDDERKGDRRREGDAQNKNVEVKKEPVEEGEEKKEGEAEQSTAKEEESLDNEQTILDYKEGDDLTSITRENYPAYSTERGVGRSFLSEFRCIQCSLCRKLLDGPETAEVHLKTWRHHQWFLRLLAGKSKATTESNDTETVPPTEETTENTMTTSKRTASECESKGEEDGNWKRRKTTDHDRDQNGHDDDIKDEPGTTDEVEGDGDGDVWMPPTDELEDWEPIIDEVLEDENAGNGDGDAEADTEEAQPMDAQPQPDPEPQPEPEPEPEQEPEPEPEPEKVAPAVGGRGGRGTPRGRARGRARRGRY